MQTDLNYNDTDEKFILLVKVFEFIENEKQCAKNNKNTTLFEPFNPFFEMEKIFLSKKGQKIYKLWTIHCEGAFSEIKEIQ